MAKVITVTYSELDAYRQCPLKWALTYQQRWTPDQQSEDGALAKGTAWHIMMEVHYTEIQRLRTREDGSWLARPNQAKQAEILAAAKAAVYSCGQLGLGADQTETQELLQWMYAGYCECYGIDVDWEILEVESSASVPLPGPNGGRSRFRLAHKIDLLIYDHRDKQVKIVDHKTAYDFSTDIEIDIDDQFALYWWLRRQMGFKIACVIRSDARTRRNKTPMAMTDRFRRKPTHRHPRELDNVALDAYRAASMAYGAGSQVYSSPDPRQCKWKCDFLEPHLAMRKAIAPAEVVLRDFKFHQRDHKHREYARGEIEGNQ